MTFIGSNDKDPPMSSHKLCLCWRNEAYAKDNNKQKHVMTLHEYPIFAHIPIQGVKYGAALRISLKKKQLLQF